MNFFHTAETNVTYVPENQPSNTNFRCCHGENTALGIRKTRVLITLMTLDLGHFISLNFPFLTFNVVFVLLPNSPVVFCSLTLVSLLCGLSTSMTEFSLVGTH